MNDDLTTWLFGAPAPREKGRPSSRELRRSLATVTGDGLTVTLVRTSRAHYAVRRYSGGKRTTTRVYGLQRAVRAFAGASR